MFTKNGNGWFHSYWKRGAVRVGAPRQAGWYAAKPECCQTVVKVLVYPNLLDCYVEGEDLKYDIYDFDWWKQLSNEHDELPKFHG